jgi:hypothetical protein
MTNLLTFVNNVNLLYGLAKNALLFRLATGPFTGLYGCEGAQAADPLPPPLCVAKSRNNLNEEFTPLLPTGIGERF